MARVTPPETSTVWNHVGETREVWPGRNYPLGATWYAEATNFAVYAPAADAMWVCLFDDDDTETRHRLTEQDRLTERDAGIRLELADRTIDLPGLVADAVRALLDGAPHAVGELPGLDADDQVVLVRRLLREGVLVPAAGS